ncbi:MAG: type II toxin-antitoxin system RelE/ParE family toxin [Acidobacteria bacterium]|jgi:proteic killer suppression protein|nr:type II toxin-antitoxin system RelE/ParE family toxin [Acidobacteriota bacterium]
MEIAFENESLDRLETDAKFDAGYSPAIVKAFRKRMQFIRDSIDERDFRAMRSLNFERLKGERSHQYSMRLNDQWRLILELHGEAPNKTVVVVSIEDYH